MATIIAFEVADAASGREALNRLTGLVDDTALAFRNTHGVVTVQQSSDLEVGSGCLGHGLLGVVVAIATTAALRMPTGGERLDRARRQLVSAGVDVVALDIAGRQIESGAAAAFMVADDATVRAIESTLHSAGYADVRCVPVPQDGVEVLRDTQRLR